MTSNDGLEILNCEGCNNETSELRETDDSVMLCDSCMEAVKDEFCKEIWSILADTCGASDSGRDAFLQWIRHAKAPNEYRFMGNLGFGGKLYIRNGSPWSVSCYPEDMTPERGAAIVKANVQIGELFD